MTLTKQQLATRRQKLFHLVRQTPDFMRPHEKTPLNTRSVLRRTRVALLKRKGVGDCVALLG